MTNSRNNFFIITGGPGSGKTTMLEELKERGFFTVDEVARQIIKEQHSIGGDAIHGKNQLKFLELMLSRSIDTFMQVTEKEKSVFFDRGIPELIGYCHLIKYEVPKYLCDAIKLYHYNNTVFLAPPWQEIYQHDTERKQTWEEAIETYNCVKNAYDELGYNLIEIPKSTVTERVSFILDQLGNMGIG